MFYGPIVQRMAVAGTAAAVVTGSNALYPKATVFAESPSEIPSPRKPIYDISDEDDNKNNADLRQVAKQESQSHETSIVPFQPSTTSPPPTEQLASQIRHARLFLYRHSLDAENCFNDVLSRVLHAESRFTSTIASLAPPRESGERLLPGSIYVLVIAMAGSIVSRNRGILLRTATPLAVGTVAAFSLLPVTMGNVSDLAWEYEKKFPTVAEKHVRLRTMAEVSWHRAIAHGAYGRTWMEEKIGERREALEKWVSKGR